MPQSYVSLRFHLIFSTKGRTPWLTESIRDHSFRYIDGILQTHNSTLLAAGGAADHVHLLVGIHQDRTVSTILRDIKANSSRWIHDRYASELPHFAWQAGYSAFSVSASQVETVRAYLKRQAEHHKTVTFQEEYRLFLERHGIAFDER